MSTLLARKVWSNLQHRGASVGASHILVTYSIYL